MEQILDISAGDDSFIKVDLTINNIYSIGFEDHISDEFKELFVSNKILVQTNILYINSPIYVNTNQFSYSELDQSYINRVSFKDYYKLIKHTLTELSEQNSDYSIYKLQDVLKENVIRLYKENNSKSNVDIQENLHQTYTDINDEDTQQLINIFDSFDSQTETEFLDTYAVILYISIKNTIEQLQTNNIQSDLYDFDIIEYNKPSKEENNKLGTDRFRYDTDTTNKNKSKTLLSNSNNNNNSNNSNNSSNNNNSNNSNSNSNITGTDESSEFNEYINKRIISDVVQFNKKMDLSKLPKDKKHKVYTNLEDIVFERLSDQHIKTMQLTLHLPFTAILIASEKFDIFQFEFVKVLTQNMKSQESYLLTDIHKHLVNYILDSNINTTPEYITNYINNYPKIFTGIFIYSIERILISYK